MAKSVTNTTYQNLISDISSIFEGARNALVKAYWEIGRRIVEVEQDGAIRAQYGDGLLRSISDELSVKYGHGFSVKNIERMRGFYLKYPKSSAPTKLNWTQYVELLPVQDKRKRDRLEAIAERKNMTSRQIREMVRKTSSKEDAASQNLVIDPPSGLKLDTFKKITEQPLEAPQDMMLIDCGFYVGCLVPKNIKVNLTDKPSYTYRAYVEKVVDGDTILARIDLGFKVQVYERLRLSCIDAPELKTPQGDKAKKYLTGILPKGSKLIIKSYKNDIYGRFIADIFYSQDDSADFDEILEKGIYINQKLLDLGLANRLEM